VDQPLLPPMLPRHLLERARTTGQAVTLASSAGFAQTFPAVLDRALLPALQAELDAGHSGCFAAFQAAAGPVLDVLAAELLAQSGEVSHPDGLPPASWFLNINSDANLRAAEAALATHPRKP
jgi:molybdopterin-guanine dinucleotide biosynthesis protein A